MGATETHFLAKAHNLWQEVRLRVDTRGVFETNVPGRVHASTVDYFIVNQVLGRLALKPDDVFVDIGCGTGRVLCLAARQRVRQVIGVDLSLEMAATAAANVETVRGRRVFKVDVVVADAAEFDYGETTCAYMFNPFNHTVLARVLDKINADRSGRPFRCAFVSLNELQRETFRTHDWLELAEEWTQDTMPIAIYRTRRSAHRHNPTTSSACTTNHRAAPSPAVEEQEAQGAETRNQDRLPVAEQVHQVTRSGDRRRASARSTRQTSATRRREGRPRE
jgi:SAM-dependent methyltransferase